LLSGAAIGLPEANLRLVVAPNQKSGWRNAILEFEFPGEMGDLFEAKPEGDGFHRTKTFEQLAGPDQPLCVQPILGTATKTGVRVTPQLPRRNIQRP